MTCLGGTARADLLLTATPVTAASGAVNGTFEVDLTNNGSSAVNVSSFSFEITTSSSDVSFQQSTTGTTIDPYIFAGNSLFGPVNSTNGPGQTLDVSDVAANPGSFTIVNAGEGFGFGEIFFNVAPGAVAQTAAVDFNTNSAFTNISDPAGNLFTLDFANGGITVVASTVPEPSSWLLLTTVFLAIVFLMRRLRRVL
jgi:hypothetical protein